MKEENRRSFLLVRRIPELESTEFYSVVDMFRSVFPVGHMFTSRLSVVGHSFVPPFFNNSR